MAETSAARDGATTDVKVLSQLSGSDQAYTFSALSTATTVAELKAKLAELLSSKPPVDHQRLIYRGRLLARDGESLSNIFGKDTSQPHILHLVVREATTTRAHDHVHPPASAAPAPHAAPAAAPFAPVRVQYGAPPPPPAVAAAPPAGVLGHSPNGPLLANAVHPQTPFDAMNAQNPGMRYAHAPGPLGIPQHMPAQHADFTAMFHGQPQMHAPFPPGVPFGNMMLGDAHHPIHAGHHAAALAAQQQAARVTPAGNSSHQRPTDTAHIINATTNGNGSMAPSRESGPPQQPHLAASGSASTPRTSTPEPRPGVHAPATGVRHATGPNGEVITFTYTASGPVPQALPNNPPPFMMPFANAFGMRPPPGAVPNQQSTQASQATSNANSWNWNNMPPLGIGQEYFGVEHAIESMRLFQNNLNNVHERVREHSSTQAPNPSLAAGFRAPIQSILRTRNRAQQLLNTLLLPGRYDSHDGLSAEDVSRFQEMNAQFSTTIDSVLRDIERIQTGTAHTSQGAIDSPAHQAPAEAQNASQPSRTAAQSSTQASSTPNQPIPVTAYLLSSPSGPQAIVYDSHGAFSSAPANRPSEPQAERPDPIFQQLRSLASNPRLHRSPQERVEDRVARAREAVNSLNRELASANEALTAASSAVTNMHNTNAASARSTRRGNEHEGLNAVPRAGEAQAQAQAPQAQAQAQIQPANDPNDFGNILFQTLWHLWTVVRVFAFIWLFTRGMSTRRTILLVVASAIYVAAQAGLFGSHLDRLRRHFEALLGLPPQQADEPVHPAEGLNVRNGQAQDQNPRAGSTTTGSNDGNRRQLPDPQAVADRLLRERREQDRGWLSERLVPVERALALFLASLYPGVGERHIQARERQLAEQRRRQEEAERASNEAAAQATAQAPQSEAAEAQAENDSANIPIVGSAPASSANAGGSSSSAQVQEGSVRERATGGQTRNEEVRNL